MALNYMYILRVTKTLFADLPHHITQRGNMREPVFFKDEDTIFYFNWLKE
jgi:putative transposase